MRSIWEDTANLPQFEPLRGDTRTDVLIIGGGMAGLLCAYRLQQAGVPYLLAEAETVCGGITANTTAKLTAQHGLIYADLLRRFGAQRARMYYDANENALREYRRLCAGIDCDFEERDAYVYSRSGREKIERELEALRRLNIPAEFSEAAELPFPTDGAVKFPRQAQFHPLRFAAKIAEGLNICEHTAVRELTERGAATDRGNIAAEQTIVATHFPFLNKHGSYFLKLYQHRSYVLALQNAPAPTGMYVDEAENGMSFRSAGDLLLLGGGGHRTGKRGGGWRELSEFAGRQFPGAAEAYRWATQDCMSLDGVPYIGQYSARTPGLYVAAGFNKWGMTSSMAAAMLLTDRILGRENENAAVFSPSRSILRPQLAVNALESAVNLLTPTAKRCPHLGCALKWNRQERSWDCPCHGSRFAEDGTLLDNPAADGLKKE